MSISRVDKNSIDQQFTATDLIGKDVYDNGGQKVGQVKDIVLGSAAGSHLAMALATGSSDADSSGSSDYATSNTTGTSTGGASAATTTRGSTATDSGSSMASTGNAGAGSSDTGRNWASEAQGALSGLTSEPAAIVSVGGFMGMGDNMVRVPLSQLNYDQSNQHLTVAISQSELASLTESGGSQAAE
jgi:hypothetical protein